MTIDIRKGGAAFVIPTTWAAIVTSGALTWPARDVVFLSQSCSYYLYMPRTSYLYMRSREKKHRRAKILPLGPPP